MPRTPTLAFRHDQEFVRCDQDRTTDLLASTDADHVFATLSNDHAGNHKNTVARETSDEIGHLRDYSWLMIEALRLLGSRAGSSRYVSDAALEGGAVVMTLSGANPFVATIYPPVQAGWITTHHPINAA